MAQDNVFTPLLPSSCPRRAVAVTPDNNNDLPVFAARGLYIVGAGTVAVDFIEGATNVTFGANSWPVGTLLAIGVRRVRSTGTSATVLALT